MPDATITESSFTNGFNRTGQSQPSTRFLDGLRGLAAVYVLIHHALLWMHPGYQNGYLKHPDQYNALSRYLFMAFYPFRFGDTTVIFFFVLSGFVIHLRYAKKFAIENPPLRSEWLPFILRRAKRLYPPLLAAIAVTFIADRIGMAQHYPIYFNRTPYAVINQNIGANHQATTLLGNLLFLMRTYVPIWGTDSPLWSLKFEWWFYFFYPALWPLLRRSSLGPTVLLLALFIFSFWSELWPMRLLRDVSSEMFVWWIGALLAEVYAGRIKASYAKLAMLALFVPAAFVLNCLGYNSPHLVWGLGFAGLIACGFHWQLGGKSLRMLDRLKFLGDCSYTLYVIHAPLVILAAGWLMSRSATGELPSSFLPAFCSLLIIPFAYLLHLFVERPFVGSAQPRAIFRNSNQNVLMSIGSID